MISMAFVVGILLMFLGNFGVRTYQISDTARQHSFADYQINRWITCIAMLLIGWIYCALRGYDSTMFNISMGVILYKFFDALADVYEGRLQQVDKLYLAGVSQTLRSLAALLIFCIVLLITRNAVAASFGMAIAAAITFFAFTWPLSLLETPKSRPASSQSILQLFKMCAPLFVAIFFFNVVENMPKFAMEAQLTYDNQLYYNALYFPAQLILISAQLVYKPLLLRMAGVWQNPNKRKKFDLALLGLLGVIVAITAIVALIMAAAGVPVLNFLYGVDFAPYTSLMLIMLITGGLQAAIDFIYQAITIMRRQKDVTVIFIMTFIFSLFIPILLVGYAGLEGAVLSYLFIEAILFVLLSWEYLKIRLDPTLRNPTTSSNLKESLDVEGDRNSLNTL
jgi:O-antigen/teichoic acid export membrane protein